MEHGRWDDGRGSPGQPSYSGTGNDDPQPGPPPGAYPRPRFDDLDDLVDPITLQQEVIRRDPDGGRQRLPDPPPKPVWTPRARQSSQPEPPWSDTPASGFARTDTPAPAAYSPPPPASYATPPHATQPAPSSASYGAPPPASHATPPRATEPVPPSASYPPASGPSPASYGGAPQPHPELSLPYLRDPSSYRTPTADSYDGLPRREQSRPDRMSVRPEPRFSEPAQPEPQYHEPPPRPDPRYSEQPRPESQYHEPARPEPRYSEPVRPEPRYSEPVRPEPQYHEPPARSEPRYGGPDSGWPYPDPYASMSAEPQDSYQPSVSAPPRPDQHTDPYARAPFQAGPYRDPYLDDDRYPGEPAQPYRRPDPSPAGPVRGGPAATDPAMGAPPRPDRRPGPPPAPQRVPEPEPDDEAEHESDGTYRGAAIAALVWCAVPVVFYVAWALLLAGRAEAGCVDDNGQPCSSPQVVAWHDLLAATPMLAAAAGLSVVIALILRWITTGWRSTTVGFASAVVASGVITVLWSTVSQT